MSARRHRPLIALVVVAAGTALAVPGSAVAADTTTVIAEADSYVASGAPNTTYGTRTTTVTDGSPKTEALSRFRVAGLPGEVTQAKLRVYANNGTPDGPVAYATTNGWSESAVTWNTKPAPVGSALDDLGTITTDTWVEYDVTSLVTGDGTYSINLVAESSDRSDFVSRETSSSRKPQLVITTEEAGPDTSIDSGPAGTTTSGAASFGFSSPDAEAGFECRLDDGPFGSGAFEPCTSPQHYFGLALGTHTFAVRAVDSSGAVDQTPAVRTWTIGLTSEQAFGAIADTYLASASPTANYGSATKVMADGSPQLEGLARFQVDGLAGTVTEARLRLYATNGAADGPLLHATASGWSETGVTWSTKPAPVGPPLDDAASVPASAWTEYDVTSLVTGDGTYSFGLVPESTDGVDFVSRESSSSNKPQLVITTERQGPDTSIDSGPSGTIRDATAAFTFSSPEDAAGFECRFDGGAWEACTSPREYSGLGDGQHRFEVRALDELGAPDATPASRTWTVDTTAPALEWRSPAANATDVGLSGDVRVRFSEPVDPATVGEATFEVAPSEGSGDPVAASVSYDAATRTATLDPAAALAERTSYTATVAGGAGGVGDPAGNRLAADEQWAFETTAIPPETTLGSGPSGTTASASASFDFSASEPGATFECRLDSGAWAACDAPKEYADLADGPHRFEVRAIDGAGAVDPTPATRDWAIDATAPSVEWHSPAAGAVDVDPSGDVRVRFSEAVDPATVTATTFSLQKTGEAAPRPADVTYDAGTRTATLSPDAVLDERAAYIAKVSGEAGGVADPVGNPLGADESWSFTTAAVPPNTTIGSGPSGTTSSASASFSFSASEPGATFECRLDSGAWTGCTSPKQYSNLGNGPHRFEVRATDGFGATDPTPARRDWTVSTGADSVLWVVGDATASSNSQATANRITGQNDGVIYTGDVYETGTAAEFANNFDPVWGKFKSLMIPTPGNHDWPNVTTGYDPYFGSRAPKTNGGRYFSVIENGWEIISLNSQESMSATSGQYKWLQQKLASGGNCRIVVFHKPLYNAGSAGEFTGAQAVWNLMANRVLFVLNGHAHNMQRANPVNGVTEIISGAGGAGRTSANEADPRFAYVNDSEHGLLKMTLEPVGANADGGATAEHRFIASDDGATLDSGSRDCTP